MSRLLTDILPQPQKEYDQSQFNQLIKQLQLALSTNVETQVEAEEREAISYFLNN